MGSARHLAGLPKPRGVKHLPPTPTQSRNDQRKDEPQDGNSRTGTAGTGNVRTGKQPDGDSLAARPIDHSRRRHGHLPRRGRPGSDGRHRRRPGSDGRHRGQSSSDGRHRRQSSSDGPRRGRLSKGKRHCGRIPGRRGGRTSTTVGISQLDVRHALAEDLQPRPDAAPAAAELRHQLPFRAAPARCGPTRRSSSSVDQRIPGWGGVEARRPGRRQPVRVGSAGRTGRPGSR